MWNDRLRIAESAGRSWETLDESQRQIARTALEQLDEDPIVGVPLYAPFRGIWSHRLGNLRILYRIAPEARSIFVLRIEWIEEVGQ
ncbi:MAG TPA: type II toxin-antitoxin system RelE/ParE family toxin [Thermoanaerobaculia bacterium]|nr:type II toxin-antitoxin system RelE/ParE family toxin [Thermoanaerobaculia bacterium]